MKTSLTRALGVPETPGVPCCKRRARNSPSTCSAREPRVHPDRGGCRPGIRRRRSHRPAVCEDKGVREHLRQPERNHRSRNWGRGGDTGCHCVAVSCECHWRFERLLPLTQQNGGKHDPNSSIDENLRRINQRARENQPSQLLATI